MTTFRPNSLLMSSTKKWLPGVIQKLEKRMSGLYGKPMTLADIYLDGIVMAPDELCIVSDLEEREETD